MKPIALSSIRKQNLRKILDLLTLSPAMTRQELSEATGLSLMTVTNLIDLLKEQEVLCLMPVQRDAGSRPATGRKAEAISLRGDQKAWLVLDLSGNHFRLTLLGFEIRPILELQDDQIGDYLERLERFLTNSREKLEAALGDRALLGVAVVAPGPYEIASDTVSNQRLPELNGVRIKALCQRCLGDYDYYVDEDVKFAVRAFHELTEQSQCEVLYYLYIGEGVGGAAVHNGNMLRGLNATAGDGGQVMDSQGVTYENRLNLDAFIRQLGLENEDDHARSALNAMAKNAPEAYQAALGSMAEVTADMLYGVLWLMDPTHVIIDCRYAQPYVEEFIRSVTEKIQQRFAESHRVLPVISAAPQGVSSVLRGTVHVLQREWMERILSR